jgi:hypothetical protein
MARSHRRDTRAEAWARASWRGDVNIEDDFRRATNEGQDWNLQEVPQRIRTSTTPHICARSLYGQQRIVSHCTPCKPLSGLADVKNRRSTAAVMTQFTCLDMDSGRRLVAARQSPLLHFHSLSLEHCPPNHCCTAILRTQEHRPLMPGCQANLRTVPAALRAGRPADCCQPEPVRQGGRKRR